MCVWVRVPSPALSLRGISPDPCGAQVAFRLCRQSPATAPVLITRPSSGSITRKLCEVGVIMVKNTPTCKGHCPYAAFCGILAPKVWAFFALFTPTFPSVDWKEEPLTLRRAADAALREVVAFRLCRQSPATAPVLITRPSSGSITRKLCEVGVIMVKNTPTCKGHCPYAAFCGILAPKVWAFFALFTPTFPSVDWKEEPLTLRRAADAALRKVAFQFC